MIVKEYNKHVLLLRNLYSFKPASCDLNIFKVANMLHSVCGSQI